MVAFYFAYSHGMSSFSQVSASPFWIPDSILLCALLMSPPRRWWIFVLAPLPIRLFVGATQNFPLGFLVATFPIDSAKGLLAAAALRCFVRNPMRLETVQEFAAFCLFAVLLIPATSAFGGATAIYFFLGSGYSGGRLDGKECDCGDGTRRAEHTKSNGCPEQEVWREVRLRSADAGGPGLPGIAARPETRRATSAPSASCRSMPATGAEMKVGDIKHHRSRTSTRGTKYMDQLMTRYFPDAKFSEANRSLFAFAAYNAGPGDIASMRKEAAKRGLDPDKWFNNVEIVTAEKIGIETTTYVRNIFKYYTTYKLTLDHEETPKKARETVKRSGFWKRSRPWEVS